jgi:hypothetical protein
MAPFGDGRIGIVNQYGFDTSGSELNAKRRFAGTYFFSPVFAVHNLASVVTTIAIQAPLLFYFGCRATHNRPSAPTKAYVSSTTTTHSIGQEP